MPAAGEPQRTDAEIIARYNEQISAGKVLDTCMTFFKARIVALDREAREITVAFTGDAKTMSNARSLQGGFAAAMLDSACAYLLVLLSHREAGTSSLEQKCSYLAPIPLGEELTAKARIVRQGKSVIFFEATLADAKGTPCVRASQTALPVPVVRKGSAASKL